MEKEKKGTKHIKSQTQELIEFCMTCSQKKCAGICKAFQEYEKELRRKKK